jgi:hypothetical protein
MKTDIRPRSHQRFSKEDIYCVCPNCGEKILHTRGVRCQGKSCPQCGTKMYREGSFHFKQWLKKSKKQKNEKTNRKADTY